MRTFTHRPRFRRSSLRSRQTPISQVNRSAEAVQASSRPGPAAAAPATGMARAWRRDAKPRSGMTYASRCCCQVCPSLAAHSSSATVRTILARCRSVPFALSPIGRARLRNSMPWPTHTPGPMKSRRSTLACSRPTFWGMRTSGAPTKCFANVWTARASRARSWWAASRLLGRRTGSAGSCMPKCSPLASTRTPGSSSKPPWKNSGTAYPVDHVPLRDPDEQLSYCIKFVTYHQPGRRLVPLPPDRLVELAAWCAPHRFEDFLFAYGARRRGGRLVVDK